MLSRILFSSVNVLSPPPLTNWQITQWRHEIRLHKEMGQFVGIFKESNKRGICKHVYIKVLCSVQPGVLSWSVICIWFKLSLVK